MKALELQGVSSLRGRREAPTLTHSEEAGPAPGIPVLINLELPASIRCIPHETQVNVVPHVGLARGSVPSCPAPGSYSEENRDDEYHEINCNCVTHRHACLGGLRRRRDQRHRRQRRRRWWHGRCRRGGVEFCGAEEGIQKTLYDLPCALTIVDPPLQIPLAVELCAKASVPNNGLVQGVETAMTHSVDVSIDPAILGLLMMFVDDAALSAAATTMTITNGTTTEALNELPAPLVPIEPVFSLDTVDTNITATADPVTVALSAFEATITGLGDLQPGGDVHC